MTYDEDNLFKKMVDGTMACNKIFETQHSIAILDAFPAVKYHSLLISKCPKTNVEDMTEEECAKYLGDLPKLCRMVKEAAKADGVNVLSNVGRAAGQVVMHAHFHVVPRYGDKTKDVPFKQMPSGPLLDQEQAKSILEEFEACNN